MAEAITHPGVHEEKIAAKLILTGSLAEYIVGIGTLVLAIIGLSGYWPMIVLSIATIGLGASFLFEAGAVASRLSTLLSEVTEGRVHIAELGGGLSAELIAGLGGIALGILSVVGIIPLVLTAIAAIAFGGALLIGAGVKHRLSIFYIGREEHKTAQEVAREVALASSGLQIMAGLGAIVLGILALLNIDPVVLSLVAVLTVSATVLFGGTALGAKMISILSH